MPTKLPPVDKPVVINGSPVDNPGKCGLLQKDMKTHPASTALSAKL